MYQRSARVIVFVLAGWSLGSRAEGQVCPCNADVNGDTVVNALDALCITDCKAGNCACCVNSCDINCDGVVDDIDVGVDPLNSDSMWRCEFIGMAASVCCGACCDNTAGVCTNDIWQSNCTGVDVSWTQGLRCSGIQCSAAPTGACCDLDTGTCNNDITQAACTGANISWTEAQACSPALCPPPPTGACCNLGNGLCVDNVLQADCATGRVWTQATSCFAAGCAVPPQNPCPCDADVTGVPGVNIIDVVTINSCALDDCSGCVGSCDVNCDGVVDFIDVGVAACQFRGKSNCCAEPVGACFGAMNVPDCATTTFDGCDLLEGTYAGDGHVCVNGVVIPAASTWGLTVLTLLLATSATLLLLARRGRRGATVV